MESAVEELLRYDSPAQNFSRLALEDIKVKFIEISARANRDFPRGRMPDY
jgi:cytochrome P450